MVYEYVVCLRVCILIMPEALLLNVKVSRELRCLYRFQHCMQMRETHYEKRETGVGGRLAVYLNSAPQANEQADAKPANTIKMLMY